MKYIILLILLSFSQLIHSKTNERGFQVETGGWVNKDGKRTPNTDAMKSINGFGGWLVVTPDINWAEKWDTPQETTPHFSETKDVLYGQQLTILPFYINPKTNTSGEQRILCDIQVIRPNGSFSINVKGIECATGKLLDNPRNVHLTSAVIKYVGEDGDPPGKWIVKINIIDDIRKTIVPLKTYFNLVKEKSK